MIDYIRREDAKHLLCRFCMGELMCKHHGDCNRMEVVNKIPASDVRENEYTTDKNGTPSLFECEKCGWESWDTYTCDTFVFCPGCGRKIISGAEMGGEKDGCC